MSPFIAFRLLSIEPNKNNSFISKVIFLKLYAEIKIPTAVTMLLKNQWRQCIFHSLAIFVKWINNATTNIYAQRLGEVPMTQLVTTGSSRAGRHFGWSFGLEGDQQSGVEELQVQNMCCIYHSFSKSSLGINNMVKNEWIIIIYKINCSLSSIYDGPGTYFNLQ